ncbi:MAG: recombination-associated protein RdgC [Gammaproteobacteria bacterium]|nr:recombination-associated protein RdgC [Gammaproteobacteria bacterium]
MWFKNLQIYRFTKPFEKSAEELDQVLQTRVTRPCGNLELSTLGWDAPIGRGGEQRVHAVEKCIMVCARREEKVLPAAVVRELVDDKAAAIEEAEGRKIRRKEREEIKDELLTDLLPKALTKSARTFAYIDTKAGWMVVDASSPKRAEELITLLRETLGTLPVRPLQVAQSPVSLMTEWVEKGRIPGDIQIQDECELRDPVEEGAIVRCRRQDLESEEIKGHLKAGKQVVKLSAEWGERLAFVLADDLSVKRLKFLDIIQEQAAEAEADDEASRFDVDFSLMTLELRRFIGRLVELLGGLEESESLT